MTRLSPQRLAKLANALGVSTPLPATPPTTTTTPTTTSRFLLHVIPPPNLPHSNSRGSLVPLYATLPLQLAAIAREYSLPSPVGLVLYLDSSGPKLSDDIWKLLWSRSLPSSPSLRPIPSEPSTPSAFHPQPDLPLPGLSSPCLLPILAKVEFDIDKRKATWYDPWLNSRLKITARRPLLLSVKQKSLSPIELDPEDELDEDATATLSRYISTQEEVDVLQLLDSMSKKSRSSSRSSSTHSSLHSLPQKLSLPPLVIKTDPEQSYLAYTEPEPEQPLRVIPNNGGRREFAVFDDFDLHLDPTLDIDDPNDRRKSQLAMSAKLDEIERTMAQLSPRILHSDLSLSFSSSERSSLRVSPTSPKLDFLSPRSQDKSFTTSSPPRLGFGKPEDEMDDTSKSWPAIPFSMIKEKEQTETTGPPPPPTLAVNGISTIPPRFVSAPTRPPPPPPLGVPMTESEKRRRELEEEQGVYQVNVRRDLTPLDEDGGVIPLSPDPFGRYPSSVQAVNGEGVVETRARSGTVMTMNGDTADTRARSGTITMTTTTTTTSKSRFSADSSEEPVSSSAVTAALKTPSNRATLMSVRTIKKLWRKSKEKGASSGGDTAPPPTPVTPTFTTSNDIDKSLPTIPAPLRPLRPSEEQLDFPDISMQAAIPPRVSPSPRGDSGRRTPLGQELLPTGRRTPQEQLVVPPPSRPSLDQPASSGQRTPQDPLRPSLDQPLSSGRRTPQDQLVFPAPPSRPSLDQLSVSPPANHLSHPSQHRPHPPQTQTAMQMPMFQGRNPYNNGPVKPLLATHYQNRLDVNRLLFDQESPYPVRVGSAGGGGGGPGAAIATTTTNMAPNYVGPNVNMGVAPPPPPTPVRPPSVEPEKSSITNTMRKSILKWKLANPTVNGNPAGNIHTVNMNVQGFSDSASTSSTSSSASSVVAVGAAVPRQSFERFERPAGVGPILNGQQQQHVRAVGGGRGRRPSVINFGSTTMTTPAAAAGMRNGRGSPQIPVHYTDSKPRLPSLNHTPHVHFKLPNSNAHLNPTPSISTTPTPSPSPSPSLSLSIPNPRDLQVTPAPRSPSQQSFDSQTQQHSPGSVERRSNASSFDMTQFEFVSPVPATHGH